jgi:hypothetical protein
LTACIIFIQDLRIVNEGHNLRHFVHPTGNTRQIDEGQEIIVGRRLHRRVAYVDSASVTGPPAPEAFFPSIPALSNELAVFLMQAWMGLDLNFSVRDGFFAFVQASHGLDTVSMP